MTYLVTSPLSAANPLPVELRQLDMELTALRFDLTEAQGLGWVADKLHLHLEVQRAAAELQLRAWQHALVERFGPRWVRS